jgi:hypothetical protein
MRKSKGKSSYDVCTHQHVLRVALTKYRRELQEEISWAENHYPQISPGDQAPPEKREDYVAGQVLLRVVKASLHETLDAYAAIDEAIYSEGGEE